MEIWQYQHNCKIFLAFLPGAKFSKACFMDIKSNISENKPGHNSGHLWLSWLILVALALIWGSSFILVKKGLQAFSPPQVASIRVFVAFLSLAPLALFSWRYVPLSKLGYLFLSGFLGIFFPAFLFAFAQSKISSLMAGILNSLTPLFALLVGVLFFGQQGSLTRYAGVVVGFLGTVALILVNRGGGQIAVNAYALLIVLAALMYGINVNLVKKYLSLLPPLHVSTLSLFLVGPFALISLMNLKVVHTYQHTPGSKTSLFFLILLGLFSTGLGTVLFNRLLQLTSALFASSVTYLIPVVAVTWGILDGEPLTWAHILSMMLIIAGVWMVNRNKH